MRSLARATLSDRERRALARFVETLRAELGDDLRSVWLYGSRARAEQPGPESDVDVLVVSERGLWADLRRVRRLLDEAAEGEGLEPTDFSAQIGDPAWLAQRRAIASFFIAEVDRDKIVLAGEP